MTNTDLHIDKMTISEVVVSKIKDYIVDNGLKPGSRLPTEQKFADSFGVSRLSVREATKTLNYLGIIDSAPRRGLTVGEFNIKRLNEFLGFHFALNDYPKEKLLRTRLIIETGILVYSSKTIMEDSDVYEKLDKICNEIDKCETVEDYISRDIRFHNVLVQVSGIEPLVMFNDLLQIFFKKFRLEIYRVRKSSGNSQNDHRQILRSLSIGNVAEAENSLKEHLRCYGEVL